MCKKYEFYDTNVDNGDIECLVDCTHYDHGDDSVGIGSGCGHEDIYDEDGELSDETNDEIISCMDNPRHCRLFERRVKRF